jgi:hypothetical protein
MNRGPWDDEIVGCHELHSCNRNLSVDLYLYMYKCADRQCTLGTGTTRGSTTVPRPIVLGLGVPSLTQQRDVKKK